MEVSSAFPSGETLQNQPPSEIAECSERYRLMTDTVVVGRGLNYAHTFEFSLKLMETCYVVVERFSSADCLHVPVAMVEASFPGFLCAPTGVTSPSTREMLDRLRHLKAETLITADRGDRDRASRSMSVPVRLGRRPTPEKLFTPIPYIIPAQIFAACLAEQKGLDPDRRRTLTKVTRTL